MNMVESAKSDGVNSTAEPLSLSCPCCLNGSMRVFHEVESVPTNSCILLKTPAEAKAWPTGRIALAYCENCGFVSNRAFDPTLTEYSGRYEETQAFSPTFNEFHKNLAEELVDRHGLRQKDIIEIGCGKGEFLSLLCELGQNRGLGYDPGYSESRGRDIGSERFEVIRDFFSEKYAERDADFVACKMTLEHIETPHNFVQTAIVVARRPNGVVFVQVPESKRIISECAFEDIYYEHCSYFTAGSLSRLFEDLGFEVINSDVTYGDQYLTVEAQPAAPGQPHTRTTSDLSELSALVESFPSRISACIDEWEKKLRGWQEAEKKVVIWGSGSKGVSFLATIPGAEVVSHAVDINPYRRGYYMPCTAQKILSPEEAAEYGPDIVIVMNRVYTDEIRAMLSELGQNPEILAL